MSLNNFTEGHLMKIEGLVTSVTAVGSPDRAERVIFGVVLAGRFLANSGSFVGGGPICDVRTPYCALTTLRRVIL